MGWRLCCNPVHGSRASPRIGIAWSRIQVLPVRPDPSTGSGLKAVEGACPEAPRRVEGSERIATLSLEGEEVNKIQRW